MLQGNTPFLFLQRKSLIRCLRAIRLDGLDQQVLYALSAIKNALRTFNLESALRTLDRAWRLAEPADLDLYAPLYGRLLSLHARDESAAFHMLQRAEAITPDPDVAALKVNLLLRSGDYTQAKNQIERALINFCAMEAGLLAYMAGEVARHPAIDAPGWVGRGLRLNLVGEVYVDRPPRVLDIQLGDSKPFSQVLRWSGSEDRYFDINLPRQIASGHFTASMRGTGLVGGDAPLCVDFAVDGRSDSRGGRVIGWARVGWSPYRPVRLRIEDCRGRRICFPSERLANSAWRWPFELNIGKCKLRGSSFVVSAYGGAGKWHALPDSPLLLEPSVRLRTHGVPVGRWREPHRARRVQRSVPAVRSVYVAIPVYCSREATLSCIRSVLATAGDQVRVLVIDDDSRDESLSSALEAYRNEGRIELITNRHNIGFVASANLAIGLHPACDVILLNSDTQVFAGWVKGLQRAAYSDARIGTVTPLSNNGSIASYPSTSGSDMSNEEALGLASLAASVLPGKFIPIPVGVGFCMYIRRDCLIEVGGLDTVVFGKGYGEEVDFCMRARQHGWSHRLAADVFVYHAGSASFGSRTKALLDRSQRLINIRFPGYDAFIASFLERNPIALARRQLDEQRLLQSNADFVLIVTLALSGGVERFVNGRCRELAAQGLQAIVLKPAGAEDAAQRELNLEVLDLPNLQYRAPGEIQSVVALLTGIRLRSIEIQHFLNVDARLIEAILGLGVPYSIFIHDYSWFCPRITLIDGTGRYCGEPSVSVCESCIKKSGAGLGEDISVRMLRRRSAQWLAGATVVMAPTNDTATRMRRHFPDLPIAVQPHTSQFNDIRLERRNSDAAVRVALIGAIGEHKGYQVLLECARDAGKRGLPLEFVVVGYTENDAPLLETGKVFVTGHYVEEEAARLLQRESPDVAWFPSVWPETWCYAVDYAIAASLPIVAFDLGGIAERLNTRESCELLPLHSPAEHINDHLLLVAKGTRNSNALTTARVRNSYSSVQPMDTLFEEANGLFMAKASNGSSSPEVQTEGVAASLQVLPVPAGLYFFSIPSSAPVPQADGILRLPALHVGLAPGVRTDDVQFIHGPTTSGTWLSNPGDTLVCKVGANGTTLVLTSVRSPSGQILSVNVERLDSRTQSGLPNEKTALGSPGTAGNMALNGSIPLQIGAHIRTRGDLTFSQTPWAGRVAPGLWIESFSIRPLEGLNPNDIESKGLTGGGFETPWITDGNPCGTKGMATPLIGFAIRLKPNAVAQGFECEYSAYFQSGTTVGPLRNGAPCRSSVANDSLEGIQLRVFKKTAEPDTKESPPPSARAAATDKDTRSPRRRP